MSIVDKILIKKTISIKIQAQNLKTLENFMSITLGTNKKIKRILKIGKSIERTFGKIKRTGSKTQNNSKILKLMIRKLTIEKDRPDLIMIFKALLVKNIENTKKNTRSK